MSSPAAAPAGYFGLRRRYPNRSNPGAREPARSRGRDSRAIGGRSSLGRHGVAPACSLLSSALRDGRAYRTRDAFTPRAVGATRRSCGRLESPLHPGARFQSMTSPLVSVLMPAYDASRFLPEAIDSILRQTCSDLELVVVDDGSADDTADILERYRRRDDRVRVCRQPHCGVAAALNRAIELARRRLIWRAWTRTTSVCRAAWQPRWRSWTPTRRWASAARGCGPSAGSPAESRGRARTTPPFAASCCSPTRSRTLP